MKNNETPATSTELLERVATLGRNTDDALDSLRLDVREAFRQLQTLQGGSGTLEPLSLIAAWDETAPFVTASAGNPTATYVGASQTLLAGRGITFERIANSPHLRISGEAAMCWDYIVRSDGLGTHTTVRAMMADFLTEAATRSGITRACWICNDDTDVNIEFGSTNGNVASATLTIQGGGTTSAANSNAITPRRTLTGSVTNAGDGYFKSAQSYVPRINFRHVRVKARKDTDNIAHGFIVNTGATLSGRTVAYFYDCDFFVGYTSSANGAVVDSQVAGAGNGATVYANDCTGQIGMLLRFGPGYAAGSLELDNCRMTVSQACTDVTTGTLGPFILRGGSITTENYLVHNTSGNGVAYIIQGGNHRHSGSSVWFSYTSGQIGSNTHIYLEGIYYSQSSTTLGAVVIAAPAYGSGHTVFVDACWFKSDNTNTATAVVVTGTNWLSTQSGIIDAPNFAASMSGMTTKLVNLTVSGTLTASIAHSYTTGLVAPADDHTQYAALVGRGTPSGNTFVGYASWGTNVAAYTSAVTAIAGLLSYWRLGEAAGPTATDNQALQNGTYTGGVTYSQASLLAGDANTSVLLNGTTGYVACTNHASYQIATGTVTAWIKTTQTGTYKGIIVKQFAYGMFLSSNVLIAYDFGAAVSRSSGVTINDGVKHFVALTFAPGAGASQLYVDGVAAGAAFASAVSNQTVQLTIGYSMVAGQFFSGTIDEPNIYNTVLTPAQIATLYAAGTGNAPAPANTVNGDVTFTRGFINNDSNFNIAFTGATSPAITFDTGDIYAYDRTGNQHVRYIGSAIKELLHETGWLTLGYGRVGSVAAPTNTTAGDLTVGRLQVGVDVAFGSPVQSGVVQLGGTLADTAAGASAFMYAQPTIAPVAASSAEFRTLYFLGIIANTAAGATVNIARGGYFETRYRGSENVAQMTGIFAPGVSIDSSSSATPGTIAIGEGFATKAYVKPSGTRTISITDLYAFRSDAINHAGATVDTFRHFSVADPTSSTFTTQVGLEIAALSRATTNFGIRNASNSVQTDYARFGAVTAPTNVTAGDVTMIRLNVGTDSAFGTGNILLLKSSHTNASGSPVAMRAFATIAPVGASTATFTFLQAEMAMEQGGDITGAIGLNFVGGVLSATTAGGVTGALRGIRTQGIYLGGEPAAVRTFAIVCAVDAQVLNRSGNPGNWTITEGIAYNVSETSKGAGAAITYTTQVGLNIPALTGAATNFGIRNASNMVQTGYLRVGAVTAPTNVTAGDVTAVRLAVGTDVAIAAADQFQVKKASFAPGATAFNGSVFEATVAPSGANSTATLIAGTLALAPTAGDLTNAIAFNMTVSHATGAFNNTGTVVVMDSRFGKTIGGTETAIIGIRSLANTISAGTITAYDLFRAHSNGLSGAGATVGTLRYYNIVQPAIGGTVTSSVGLNIPNLGGANVTNAVGIDLAAQSGAVTLNFGIRNAGNMVQTGYLRVGAVTAPTNVTNGDLTAIRAVLGTDAAMPASTSIYLNAATRFNGSVGFFNVTPAAQQTSGANVTNNVTAGGVNDTIANFTDLVIYANDAAAIRDDIYQLARKLKQVNDGLRLYGLLT